MQHQQHETSSRGHQMPGWNLLPTPQPCEVCGRAMMPTGLDWVGQWGAAGTPLWEGWNRMWTGMFDQWMQVMRDGFGQAAQSAYKPHTSGCGCSRCAPDDCQCRCCVTNADLLVYARVGERRVVPLVIENNLRREREVEFQLSDWTTHTGQPTITGVLLPPTKFTLKACEERGVTLLIDMISTDSQAAAVDAKSGETNPPAGPADYFKNQERIIIPGENRPLPDVEDCKVYYADLRVKGCDLRPVRIAVALLPRDCAAFKIECCCVCC